LGRNDESVDFARRAVTIAPEDHDAWIMLGEALLDKGDRAGAQAAVERAAELRPASAPARTLLSRIAATGDPPGASGPAQSP
jgi:Flp pilus assembly protein TadD